MAAPYSAIRAAFAARLLAFPSVPSIAWENVAFTPVAGVTYLQPELLPAEPVQAEIGTNGGNHHFGIYQISIKAPAGGGIGTAATLRDGLLDHFKRGTQLVYNGLTVQIEKAFTGPALQDTDRLHIPISIRFRAYSSN